MTALSDRLFSPAPAIHANGDRWNARPAHVEWNRDWWDDERLAPIPGTRNIWYTDGHAPRIPKHERPGITTIGLLLEPPGMHPENYKTAREALDNGMLDVLFTHQPQEFDDSPAIAIYPLGGTTVHEADWSCSPLGKRACVSAIASSKRTLPGHILRHEIISDCKDIPGFDAYGPDYTPVPLNRKGFYAKAETCLKPYMYSVAIESVNTGYLLSEHVLDCFLTGTIPIYWGPPDALIYWGFDLNGVIVARDRETLSYAVKKMFWGRSYYIDRLGAIERNFLRALNFVSTEDWLYSFNPELFE